ncbi:RDD family protein [Rothia sp. CCM 9417]|uniref:RDD family protein n=1 Tax=Rothia sp. CCM 9417 TaxID=3402657 RepID=UPI003AEB2993
MNSFLLVPAPLYKRALAYFVDLLIVAAPAGYAMCFAISFLFEPSPLVGWLTCSALALIVLAYTLILAAQNASSGQTAGKRLVGIRTLRAESLRPGDFSDAYARGFSFLLGLLGLGIRPFLMAYRFKTQVESESWPHKAGNTRVLDVRAGKDPLNVEKRFFPLYPEEWSGKTATPVEQVFPPRATGQSATADISSGQSDSGVARVTVSDHLEVARKRRRSEGFRSAGQGLITIGASCLTVAALVFAANELNPEMPKPQDQREVLAASLTQKLPVAGYSGQGFPGYKEKPDWSESVSPDAKVFSTVANVFSFESRRLTVFSVDTGEQVANFPLDQAVEVSAQTSFSGTPGIYWSIGDTAFGWSSGTGADKPFSAKIPAGAQPYAAGNELLFAAEDEKNGQYKAWRFSPDGFQEIKIPSGFVPGSFSGQNMVSYSLGGEIKVTDSQGQEISAYPLASPKDSLPFDSIVSVGHQRIVATWSPYPDSVAPTTPVTVAFYDTESGNLLSYIETTQERISAYPDLLWGPDGHSALYAGYLFDVEKGRADADLIAQGIEPITVIGQGALGSSNLGNVYMEPDEVQSISGITPLLANQDIAIIRTHNNKLEKYTK